MLFAVIDPGVTTGLVLLEMDPRTEPVRITILRADEIKGVESVFDYIYTIITQTKPENLTVLYERFIIQQTARHTEPMEIIGVIKFLHRLYGFNIISQIPSAQAAPKATLDDLRIMYKKFPHISSCLFHTMFYLATKHTTKKVFLEHKGFLEEPLTMHLI